jgi:hypothetical protein
LSAPNGNYADNHGEKLTSAGTAHAENPATIPSGPTAATVVGWHGDTLKTGVDLIVDLGKNMPIGTIATDWWNVWGATVPTTLGYATHPDGDGTPDSTTDLTTGWTTRIAPKATPAGASKQLTRETTTIPATAPGKPVQARWVRIHFASTTEWAMAASINVYTPGAIDTTIGQTPTAYPGGSTVNGDYSPWQPLSDTNWPTTRSTAFPAGTIADPCPTDASTYCQSPGESGIKFLTGGTPPTPGATNGAGAVTLKGKPGWDLIVPTTGSPSRVDAPTISFVYHPDWAVALPTSIDLDYTTSTTGTDQTRTWKWASTQTKPLLPPYIPYDTALVHTYTFPALTSSSGAITKVRYHLNTPGQVLASHLQNTNWNN